jgi:hypothetical protein
MEKVLSRTRHISILFALIFLCGCAVSRHDNYMASKGYDHTKDTLIVKPYEYFKKSKGFTPNIRECKAVNPSNIGISIRGFEDQTSVPIDLLKNSAAFVLTDTAIHVIESGTLYHVGDGGSAFYDLKTLDIDSFKLEFAKKGMRHRPGQSLIIFCVKVRKGDQLFTLPARHYRLR